MKKSSVNSKSPRQEYRLLNPLPTHYRQMQDLCRKVYPFYRPWSLEELESHRSYFPDGQLIVVETKTDRVVGLAFSLIISWNDYSPQDSWLDYTSGGFFHNHDPKNGKTLYGAEVMVDPDCRGKGIGKLLYEGRRQIVKDYKLKRIRAGARIRNYHKHKEKLTPQEYTRKVVNGELTDPTLSFQLSQGFKVIDVAANYTHDDPETLGYAAVIEWLNPDTATANEIEKQNRVVNRFSTNEKFSSEYLPRELRRLVRKSTTAVGNSIREIEGEKFFRKIEDYRESLKKARGPNNKKEILATIRKRIAKESPQEQLKIAHAFSLQLEVVNVCEAVYRSWKLRQKSYPTGLKSKLNLTYVLTAHPTEARSKDVIQIFSRLQKLLSTTVHSKFMIDEAELSTIMKMLWLQPLSKSNKPQVVDEAEYIFSTVFESEVFDFLLSDEPGYDLKLRTWVGGDKDGHPGVDEKVMVQCLELSRSHLIRTVDTKLKLVTNDLMMLTKHENKHANQVKQLNILVQNLTKLRKVGAKDGTRLKVWITQFRQFSKKAHSFVQGHREILQISRMLDIFPGLVFPIELREDAELIEIGLRDNKSTIRKMLMELEKISGAIDITAYARGLVISHCESKHDIENACTLIDQNCRQKSLPVIPLFESREALKNSKTILTGWLSNKKNHDRARRFWQSKFEVMLGYSDSSKQIGVLPSRILIYQSMRVIDKTIRDYFLTPIFFHGSGGSVARGGGSITEQISWWSRSAIESPKMTVQGEMIQRLFSSREIVNSQCAHLTREALRRKTNKVRFKQNKVLEKLADLIEHQYTELVSNTQQLDTLLEATPYHYLSVLKIGSRPAKRPSHDVQVSALRAIPWVLCWTQTRTLLPSWWGVGTAWTQLTTQEKESLISSYGDDPFLSSFVKTLGFTLEKVELDVWELYFAKPPAGLLKLFEQELLNAKKFVLEVTQQSSLLSHRPWLKESIYLRSPHIHILNMLQIEAMKRDDETLLKETIVGIASGMMTTG